MPAIEFTDYYALLAVKPDAPVEEIRRAYTDRIKLFHPDRFQNRSQHEREEAETKSQQLNQAKEILLDEEKRLNYDLTYRYYTSLAATMAAESGFGGGIGGNFDDYLAQAASHQQRHEQALESQGRSRIFLFLAIVMMSGLAVFWRFVNPADVEDFSKPQEAVRIAKPQAESKAPVPLISLTLTPDGSRLIAAGETVVQVWNSATPDNLQDKPQTLTLPASVLAVAASNRFFAVACKDNTVRLYALDNQAGGVPYKILSGAGGKDGVDSAGGHTQPVCDAAFNGDGSLLATSSWDKTIKVWKVADGSLQRTLLGIAFPIYRIAFTADGSEIVFTESQQMRRWSWQGGMLKALTLHRDQVNAVALSGEWAASAGRDKIIRQVNLKSGATRSSEREPEAVTAIRFSPDGNAFATAGTDGVVRIYSSSTSRRLESISAHRSAVTSIAFSPDARSIYSVGADSALRVWAVSPVPPAVPVP